jgi:hypothetical protein
LQKAKFFKLSFCFLQKINTISKKFSTAFGGEEKKKIQNGLFLLHALTSLPSGRSVQAFRRNRPAA